VLVVQIFREVISEEDGPDDRKGPDIGMEVEWYCQAVRIFGDLPSRKGVTNKDCEASQMRSADYRREAPWRIAMSKMRVEREAGEAGKW